MHREVANQHGTQVLSVGESVAVSIAVTNGYGSRFATVDSTHFDAVMKVCKKFGPCTRRTVANKVHTVAVFRIPIIYSESIFLQALLVDFYPQYYPSLEGSYFCRHSAKPNHGLGRCGVIRQCFRVCSPANLGLPQWPLYQPGAFPCHTISCLFVTQLIANGSQMAWKYYFCASNIVTESLIILQALFLIGRIQASWKKKVIFGSIFLTRILYVAS